MSFVKKMQLNTISFENFMLIKPVVDITRENYYYFNSCGISIWDNKNKELSTIDINNIILFDGRIYYKR